jgi:hypothetical protein
VAEDVRRVKVLRGMLRHRDGLPKVGETGSRLGARPQYFEDDIDPEDRIRPGDRIIRDISVSEEGLVQPRTGGMSAFFHPVDNLPPHRRPPKHGGDDPRYEVYELETDDLPEELQIRIDPYNERRHVFIEPAREMTFEEYQKTLHATRDLWHTV